MNLLFGSNLPLVNLNLIEIASRIKSSSQPTKIGLKCKYLDTRVSIYIKPS